MALDTTSQRWNNWVRVIMARQLRAQPSGKPLRDRTPGEKLPWTTKCRTNPLSAPAHATRVPWSTPNNLAAVSAGYLGKMLKAFTISAENPQTSPAPLWACLTCSRIYLQTMAARPPVVFPHSKGSTVALRKRSQCRAAMDDQIL